MPLAKLMGMTKQFRPPANGFRRNLEYITKPRVWPHAWVHVALRQRGWSRRSRDLSHVLVSLVYFFLLYSSARAKPSTIGPILAISTSYDKLRRNEVLFGGSGWDYCHLRDQISQKRILEAWVAFSSLTRKNIKTSMLSKLLHWSQPNFAQW